MDLKTNILSLEEEMTNVEVDSFREEQVNAKDNYCTLDEEYLSIKSKIPYPEISQYSTAIDYEDQLDLQHKKRSNEKYLENLREIKDYADDGSLYCGHCKVGDNDVYLMDDGMHQTKHFKRKDGTEFLLLNVNDRLYQHLVNMWRFPSDYSDVILSRNILLKNRNVREVDVVFESTDSNFSKITDGYLRKALLRNKNNSSVCSIIQTIQRKQDDIRSYDKKTSFVVQGCAGSGKTMVLLHRLRYLLYNKEISSEEYVLLIPSDRFRSFINELLTKFNIRKSNILSYQEYYAKLLDREIISDEINDELVFENDYLYNVYSKEFLKKCYREFFGHVIEQNEILIRYCEESLTNKLEEERQTLQVRLDNLDHVVLNKLNKYLINVSTYIGIEKIESIKDALLVLDLLQDEYKQYLSILNSNKMNNNQSVILDVDEQIENNESLSILKNQIEKEIDAYQNASIFTKRSHKRKLEQLQEKYEQQKEELVKYFSENSDYIRRERIARLNTEINKIIACKLNNTINIIQKILKDSNDEKKFIEEVILDLDETFFSIYQEPIEKLNYFIEDSSCIADFEREYVNGLNPSNKLLQEIIYKGQDLVISYVENGLFNHDNLSKKTKLFTKRTNLQLDAYLNTLLFSLVKSNLFRIYRIKICKVYKHYWFLQLYCKYLVGNLMNKKNKYIFVDEAQDLSPNEIDLIYKINKINENNVEQEPILNLFGDVNQTISDYAVKDWKSLNLGLKEFMLDENFRNTNQIVEYCNNNLPFTMKKIGVDMDEVIIYQNLSEAKNNSVIKEVSIFVVKDEFVKKDFFNLLKNIGWKQEYTIFTVKEVKGLEFKEIFVIDCEMTENEKYIAYTRALANLNIIKNIPLSKTHNSLIIDGDEDNGENEAVKEYTNIKQYVAPQKKEQMIETRDSMMINDEIDYLKIMPKDYREKLIVIKCCGKLQGNCYLIPYNGKLKKIDDLNLELYFIPVINKKGKESLVPINLDVGKRIAFITLDNYKSFIKQITSKEFLEIRKNHSS